MAEPDERWLSPRDLAERYGLPVKTIYTWNFQGKAPERYKMGRNTRYTEKDVLAWEKRHKIEPNPPQDGR